ncbi:MAG: amino acid transporter, partial [Halieaceae bacterium]
MKNPKAPGISVSTLTMIIVVATFGFANVIDNLVEIGLSAIPSWFLVGVLYFLPLALILAEFASDTKKTGGIYSYMERGLGEKWAFVGTWSYFVSNLMYLQSSFSRLPVRISLSITGTDIFENAAILLPIFGVLLCILITCLACRGVKRFSIYADWFGRGTIALVVLLVLVPVVLVVGGWRQSATPFTTEALIPTLDLDYFATFSWLLFAVGGAEVAAPYVSETRNPAKDFPRAIIVSTVVIAVTYVLATVAVALLVPLSSLTLATGLYDIWEALAEMLGIQPQLFARACMIFLSGGAIAAFVVWAESPIRVMFSEVPSGTFPSSLTKSDDQGTLRNALWMQAMLV